jgi:hypothetical protein
VDFVADLDYHLVGDLEVIGVLLVFQARVVFQNVLQAIIILEPLLEVREDLLLDELVKKGQLFDVFFVVQKQHRFHLVLRLARRRVGLRAQLQVWRAPWAHERVRVHQKIVLFHEWLRIPVLRMRSDGFNRKPTKTSPEP